MFRSINVFDGLFYINTPCLSHNGMENARTTIKVKDMLHRCFLIIFSLGGGSFTIFIVMIIVIWDPTKTKHKVSTIC